MDRQQVMFVETHGQVLNRLQASLFGTHADWDILFMADASAALGLISQRKAGFVLANFGMDNAGCEGFFRRLRKKAPEVIRTGLQPDQAKRNVAKSLEYPDECNAAHSMFDGLVQWKLPMDKLVEQGLIQLTRDSVENLTG